MDNTKKIDAQAHNLSNDDDVDWRNPIEYHETDVKKERVKGKDDAVDSYLLFFESNNNSQNCEKQNDDQEYRWVWKQD